MLDTLATTQQHPDKHSQAYNCTHISRFPWLFVTGYSRSDVFLWRVKSAHFSSSFLCLFNFFSTYTPGPATDSAANIPLSVVFWWPVWLSLTLSELQGWAVITTVIWFSLPSSYSASGRPPRYRGPPFFTFSMTSQLCVWMFWGPGPELVSFCNYLSHWQLSPQPLIKLKERERANSNEWARDILSGALGPAELRGRDQGERVGKMVKAAIYILLCPPWGERDSQKSDGLSVVPKRVCGSTAVSLSPRDPPRSQEQHLLFRRLQWRGIDLPHASVFRCFC